MFGKYTLKCNAEYPHLGVWSEYHPYGEDIRHPTDQPADERKQDKEYQP